MQTQNHHVSAVRGISRRQVLALLSGAGLMTLPPQLALAVSIDFAAFNQRYIAEIIVPRFARLKAACVAWNETIEPMVRMPSAGKASMLGHGDGDIWDAWMAAEPFMYEPGRSQKREVAMAGWARRPDELVDALNAALAGDPANDLSSMRINESLLGQHSLEVMTLLLESDGKDRDIIRDFYVAENGSRRTLLLQAILANMAAEAAAAETAWARASKHGAFADDARMAAAQFLADQADLLNNVLTHKMKVPVRPAVDFSHRTGLEDRLGASIMSNLATTYDAIHSSAGFSSLLPANAGELRVAVRNACEAMVSQGNHSVARGYPSMTYTADFFLNMCCFSPCPPLSERELQAEQRNNENQQHLDMLKIKITLLRNLLQFDLADATGLSTDIKKI